MPGGTVVTQEWCLEEQEGWQIYDVNAPSVASSIHFLYNVISGLLLSRGGDHSPILDSALDCDLL